MKPTRPTEYISKLIQIEKYIYIFAENWTLSLDLCAYLCEASEAKQPRTAAHFLCFLLFHSWACWELIDSFVNFFSHMCTVNIKPRTAAC